MLPVIAAAEFGHTAVVDALLARLAREPLLLHGLLFDHEEAWSIACRRSNFAMASSVLSAMGTQYIGHYLQVSKCLEGTPVFFRDVLPLIGVHLKEASQTYLLCVVLKDTIEHRQRHHVEILLDKIDQDRSLFSGFQWVMQSVLRWRSTAILRDVLTRYPEASTSIADCDPLLAIQDYHWPVGARLLVEAGAKIEGIVPSKFVGL